MHNIVNTSGQLVDCTYTDITSQTHSNDIVVYRNKQTDRKDQQLHSTLVGMPVNIPHFTYNSTCICTTGRTL